MPKKLELVIWDDNEESRVNPLSEEGMLEYLTFIGNDIQNRYLKIKFEVREEN